MPWSQIWLTHDLYTLTAPARGSRAGDSLGGPLMALYFSTDGVAWLSRTANDIAEKRVRTNRVARLTRTANERAAKRVSTKI